MKTAFLGLGLMGYPMAGHLAKQFQTLVWTRNNEKLERHRLEFNTTIAATPEAAAEVDVLFTCLPTSAEVLAMAPKILEHAKSGLVWVDCTSGDPASARELASMLEQRNMHFLDAPVSGGVKGAIAGQLTTMIGGDAQVLGSVREVIATFASKIVHVGPVGAGMAVKAANQALLGINILALTEVLLGLEKQGVSGSRALEVINASSGRSNVSQNLFPERVIGRAFPNTFALALLTKDVRIAAQSLREQGIPAPLVGLTENLLEVALRQLGDVDHVAAAQLLESWVGLELGLS
ncbi:MAG: NAD(P)-dependent oxidoreductase [Deinococcales bacterium]